MIINNKKLAKDLSTNKMEWLVGFIKELVVVDKLAIHEAIKSTKQNYCINFEWNNIDFIYMLFIKHIGNIDEKEALEWEWTENEDTWEEYIITSEYNNYKDILYKFFWELNSVVTFSEYYKSLLGYEKILDKYNNIFKIRFNFELWISTKWFHEITGGLYIPLASLKEINNIPTSIKFRDIAKMKFENNLISIIINWNTLEFYLDNIKNSDHKKWLVLLWVIYNMWEKKDFLEYKWPYENILDTKINPKNFLEYKSRIKNFLKNNLWLDFYVTNKYSDKFDIIKK